MSCATCPVSEGGQCLAVLDPERFGFFCEWAASGDPVKIKHVVNRSALGCSPPAPTPRQLARADKPRVPLGTRPPER